MNPTTVILTLAAPAQSWGHLPRGAKVRPTQDHPTKRGVIGLIANALGRDRADDISDLSALQFAVRADRAGIIDSDYQTAGGRGQSLLLPGEVMANPKWRKAAATREPNTPAFGFDYLPPRDITTNNDGELVGKPNNPSLTDAQYVADAVFTVALTGSVETVTAVADGLDNPARAIFLGRKAYLPSEPVLSGTTSDTDAHTAVTEWPLHEHATNEHIPVWSEVPPATPGSVLVTDEPINYLTRRSLGRAELHTFIPGPDTSTAPAPDDTDVADLDLFTDAP